MFWKRQSKAKQDLLLASSSLPQELREIWTGLKGGLKIICWGEGRLAALAGMAPGAMSRLPHCCRVRAGPGKGREAWGAEREGYAGEVLSRILQGSLAIQIYIVLIENMSELRVP